MRLFVACAIYFWTGVAVGVLLAAPFLFFVPRAGWWAVLLVTSIIALWPATRVADRYYYSKEI